MIYIFFKFAKPVEPPSLAARGSARGYRQILHGKDDYPEMANLLGRRNRRLGVSVIALTALIGTSAFLSMIATAPW
jgi:hypothetical protein